MLFIFSAFSDFGQTNTNALPTLAPPYGELPPTFWEQHDAAVLTGGFVIVTLAVTVLWLILKPRSQPIVPPATVAREALVPLQRRPENGAVLSEVSQILRRYVATAFALPAAELTTAEFCVALAASERVGAELAGALSSFLRECDERKFAPAGAPAPLQAAARALELVSLAEKIRGRRDTCLTEK